MYARMQATSAKHYGEKDARLEYLSWRVWFMKRNRAKAKLDHAQAHSAGLVEDATAVPAGLHGAQCMPAQSGPLLHAPGSRGCTHRHSNLPEAAPAAGGPDPAAAW